MRKALVLLATAALLIALFSASGATVVEGLFFYVRVAQLYTEAPDTKVSMPLKDVTKKQIANTWHAARGTDRLHEGQDIFAAKGTPVYSATPGYVFNIGENHLGGQTVSVIGAGGRIYYYAHLSSYAPGLETEQPVTTDTLLGFVGTTGNAQGTPPHLHFGIYTTSGAINPLPLLSDRSTLAVSKRKQNESKTRKRVAMQRA
ncbi:MAG: M23 family metallopeptidase [Pyrinomonadaceae bacterium]